MFLIRDRLFSCGHDHKFLKLLSCKFFSFLVFLSRWVRMRQSMTQLSTIKNRRRREEDSFGGVGERVLSSISDPIREIGELQNIIMKILI